MSIVSLITTTPPPFTPASPHAGTLSLASVAQLTHLALSRAMTCMETLATAPQNEAAISAAKGLESAIEALLESAANAAHNPSNANAYDAHLRAVHSLTDAVNHALIIARNS